MKLTQAEVLTAAEVMAEQNPDGFTLGQVAKTFFPEINNKRLAAAFTVLHSRGKVIRVGTCRNDKGRPQYIYKVPQPGTQPSTDGKVNSRLPGTTSLQSPPWKADPPPSKEMPSKKRLAIECEVCAALVGLKAQEKISFPECSGCGAVYLLRDGWCFRLGVGIKAQVWAPIAPTNGNS